MNGTLPGEATAFTFVSHPSGGQLLEERNSGANSFKNCNTF